MNKGVAHATGEYLLFLNSGDFLEPEVIATVLNELTGTDIIYGDIIFQTTNGERQTMVYPDTLSTEYMFQSHWPPGHIFPTVFVPTVRLQ